MYTQNTPFPGTSTFDPLCRYGPDEEWTNVQNIDERRKIQNRLAQRRRRTKSKRAEANGTQAALLSTNSLPSSAELSATANVPIDGNDYQHDGNVLLPMESLGDLEALSENSFHNVPHGHFGTYVTNTYSTGSDHSVHQGEHVTRPPALPQTCSQHQTFQNPSFASLIGPPISVQTSSYAPAHSKLQPNLTSHSATAVVNNGPSEQAPQSQATLSQHSVAQGNDLQQQRHQLHSHRQSEQQCSQCIRHVDSTPQEDLSRHIGKRASVFRKTSLPRSTQKSPSNPSGRCLARSYQPSLLDLSPSRRRKNRGDIAPGIIPQSLSPSPSSSSSRHQARQNRLLRQAFLQGQRTAIAVVQQRQMSQSRFERQAQMLIDRLVELYNDAVLTGLVSPDKEVGEQVRRMRKVLGFDSHATEPVDREISRGAVRLQHEGDEGLGSALVLGSGSMTDEDDGEQTEDDEEGEDFGNDKEFRLDEFDFDG